MFLTFVLQQNYSFGLTPSHLVDLLVNCEAMLDLEKLAVAVCHLGLSVSSSVLPVALDILVVCHVIVLSF